MDAFGKKKDADGYLAEKDSGERVLTSDGQYIKEKKFAGVIKGSELYINDDIASLVKLSDAINKKQNKR